MNSKRGGNPLSARSRMLFWASLWKNPKIEVLTTQERYLLLYFNTGPMSNFSGCYQIGLKRIVSDTGLGLDDVWAGLTRLRELGLVWYNSGTKELLVIDGLRQVFTGAPKGNRRIEREIANVKDFVFRILVRGDYLRLKAAFEKQKGAGQRE